mmetsp:Transcript_27527/g.79187  ORF Transcript_27527/g.79187 Transcript_27527/m.79187 type:complete len:279 (-) Transcript_27527:297-1133(-)
MHTLDKTDNQEPASQPARQKYESYTQVRLRTRSPTRSARHPHSLPSHTCGTNRRQMHGAINGRSACLPACLSVWCLVYLALPPTHLHLHAFTLAPLPTLARPATQPLRSVRGSRGESQDFTVYTEGHGLDTQTDRQVDREGTHALTHAPAVSSLVCFYGTGRQGGTVHLSLSLSLAAYVGTAGWLADRVACLTLRVMVAVPVMLLMMHDGETDRCVHIIISTEPTTHTHVHHTHPYLYVIHTAPGQVHPSVHPFDVSHPRTARHLQVVLCSPPTADQY